MQNAPVRYSSPRQERYLRIQKPAPARVFTYVETRLNAENPVLVLDKTIPRPKRGLLQMHGHWEMGIVFSGAYRQVQDRSSLTLGRGGIWFAGPWEPHRWETLRPNTELMIIEFYPATLYSFPAEPAVPVGLLLAPFLRPDLRPALQRKHPREMAALLRLAREMQEEAREKRRGWRSFLRLRLWELLLEIMRGRHAGSGSFRVPHLDLERVLSVVEQVHRDLSRTVTLREAAGRASLSRNEFIRRFRAVMGTSFRNYVVSARLQAARNDVLDGVKIAYLARKWGFSDSSHFRRMYRRHFGRTPSQEQKNR